MTTRRVVLPLAGVAAAAVGLLLGSGDLFAGQGSSVGAASVDFAVKRDSDAAEEAAGKEVDLDSSDLELVFDDGTVKRSTWTALTWSWFLTMGIRPWGSGSMK